MSVTLWAALLLQAVSVALLRLRLGKTWLRRPGTLVVLTSAAYLGVSPVLLSFPSVRAWDTFTNGLGQSYAGEAALIMSAAMLAFTAAYLMTRPHRPAGTRDGDVTVLDWRLLALACAPLAALTYEGRGYIGSKPIGAGASAASTVTSSFFVILVVLAAYGYVLRHGRFLPVLAAQSVLLAAAGERTPVLIDAVTLIVLLCHAGRRPSSRQLDAAVAVTVIAMLAITGLRAERGRSLFADGNGLGARVTALAAGLLPGGSPVASPGLVAQAASRLDGVSFTGLILQSEALGQPRLGAAGVPESLMLAVPSVAWPSKLSHATALEPVQAEIDAFGLQQVNYLAPLPGFYAGFLSWPWLIVLAAVTGVLWGRGERWLLRRRSPARMVLLAGAVTAAFRFEQGPPGMLLAIRTAALVAGVVWLAQSRPTRNRAGFPAKETKGLFPSLSALIVASTTNRQENLFKQAQAVAEVSGKHWAPSDRHRLSLPTSPLPFPGHGSGRAKISGPKPTSATGARAPLESGR